MTINTRSCGFTAIELLVAMTVAMFVISAAAITLQQVSKATRSAETKLALASTVHGLVKCSLMGRTKSQDILPSQGKSVFATIKECNNLNCNLGYIAFDCTRPVSISPLSTTPSLSSPPSTSVALSKTINFIAPMRLCLIDTNQSTPSTPVRFGPCTTATSATTVISFNSTSPFSADFSSSSSIRIGKGLCVILPTLEQR